MSGSYGGDSGVDTFENVTLSCASQGSHDPIMLPYSTSLTTSLRIIQAGYSIFLMICGAFLNFKVIFLVVKHKRLRTLSFVIALQVVVLDIVVRSFTGIVAAVNMIANRWVFGELLCSVVGMTVQSSFEVRLFLMFTFVVDRFLLVYYPFSYPKHRVKFATSMSVISWIFSFATGFIAFGMDCFTFSPAGWLCRISGNCSKTCGRYAAMLYGTIIIPLTLTPIFLYAILYNKSRKIRKAFVSSSTDNVTDTANALSNEWRATLTFFLLFITVFVLTLPSMTIYVTITHVYGQNDVPVTIFILEVIAASLIGLLVLTDPVVILRNKDVRDITKQFGSQNCCRMSLPLEANI